MVLMGSMVYPLEPEECFARQGPLSHLTAGSSEKMRPEIDKARIVPFFQGKEMGCSPLGPNREIRQ